MNLSEAIQHYQNHSPRGEYVLVLQGKSQEEIDKEEEALWQDLTIEEHIKNIWKQALVKRKQ